MLISQEAGTAAQPHLIGSFTLILHTNLAIGLLNGNWKFQQMGLIQFIQATARLWQAHRNDDPYADWYLLKIYQAIVAAKEELESYEKKLTLQMSNLRGLEIDLFKRSKPLRYTLNLMPPFTFIMAELVEQIDFVMRQLVTLMRMCVVPPNDLNPAVLKRKAQYIFTLVRQWRQTGVTRADIQQNNTKAQKAREVMKNEVPMTILNQEFEFPFFSLRKASIVKN